MLNNRNYNVNPTANRQTNLSPNPFLNAYRQTYQNQAPSTPAVRPEYVPNSPALANQQTYRPAQNAAPVYNPNPRNNARVGGGVYAPPPPSLPRPLPLKSSESQPQPLQSGASVADPGPPPPVPSQLQLQQKTLQNRVAQIPGNYEHGEGKKSGSNGIFADLVGGLKLPDLPKLPSFPSFFGGGQSAKEKDQRAHHRNGGSTGEAIPVSLGVKPQIKLDVSALNKVLILCFFIIMLNNCKIYNIAITSNLVCF